MDVNIKINLKIIKDDLEKSLHTGFLVVFDLSWGPRIILTVGSCFANQLRKYLTVVAIKFNARHNLQISQSKRVILKLKKKVKLKKTQFHVCV